MAITTTGRGVSYGTESQSRDMVLAAAFIDLSGQDDLTAKVGGGQSGATSVAAYQYSRFTGVASAGDSSVLGGAILGRWRVVTNAHATNAMNVYPAVGEQINALGLNNPFSIPATKTCFFFAGPAGRWSTLLGA